MAAENGRNVLPDGSSDETGRDSPSSSEVSPAQALTLLLQMHKELLAMVGALIEQNQQILDAVNDVADDPERAPRTYLDGTPV